ncbi:MAG: 2-C-methyl-D-erythritol 2,4-cyclodiphosphate synthase [Clostridiales bacterium]|nr:2-C-methyl-D-erythritol 2,4-cyclodiphosphate synthase [Clostridiales bacterium]
MITGIGQDSHRFEITTPGDDAENSKCKKKLILGGVIFDNCPPLEGNSDADVVLHALTNAISGISCVNILGAVSDKMCFEMGITNSSEYLREALKYLDQKKITHVSFSIECWKPKISPKILEMRQSISILLRIPENCVGITATSGEGLTAFGRGEGIQVFCCISAE